MPKGRTRRTVPMTGTLYDTLKRMKTIREAFVVRNLDGTVKTAGDTDHAIARICGAPACRVASGTRYVTRSGPTPRCSACSPATSDRRDDGVRARGREPRARAARTHPRGQYDPGRRILAILGARGSLRGKVAATIADPSCHPRRHQGDLAVVYRAPVIRGAESSPRRVDTVPRWVRPVPLVAERGRTRWADAAAA